MSFNTDANVRLLHPPNKMVEHKHKPLGPLTRLNCRLYAYPVFKHSF